MIFLKHTDAHIPEVIKRKHFARIHKDGIRAECPGYYKKNMNHPLFLDGGSEI
ncbi:MAG: hypothetical protein BWY42_00631 [Candidatus Omnitrophica bacterium ADurb.Bin277]|nr:MAG: hypothetical protein BWY42_00631 [Candidatus Omnitrophica bacterium ADurb.Bin277]